MSIARRIDVHYFAFCHHFNLAMLSIAGLAKRRPIVLWRRLQEEVCSTMRWLQWIHSWGEATTRIWNRTMPYSNEDSQFFDNITTSWWLFNADDGDSQVGHRSVSEPWGKLGTPNTFPVLWVLQSLILQRLHLTFVKSCQKSLTEGTGFHEHKGR